MKTLIYLETKYATDKIPDCIICRDKNDDIWIATIFSNLNIEFSNESYSIDELTQIKLVADNFRFFFDNLTKK